MNNKKSLVLAAVVFLLLLVATAAWGLLFFLTQNLYAVRADIEEVQAKYMAYSGVYYCLHKYLNAENQKQEWEDSSGKIGFNCWLSDDNVIESSGYSKRSKLRRAKKEVTYEQISF